MYCDLHIYCKMLWCLCMIKFIENLMLMMNRVDFILKWSVCFAQVVSLYCQITNLDWSKQDKYLEYRKNDYLFLNTLHGF